MKQAFRLLSLTVTLLLLLVSLPTAPVVHADPLPPDAPSASGGRSIFLPLITRDGCNAQRQETRANGWRYIAVCSKAIVQRGPYNSQNGAYAIWWKTPRADQVYRLALIEQTAPPVALLATEPAAEPQQVAEGLILGTAAICVACIIVGIVLIGVTYWAITEYQQYAASQPAYTEQQIVSDSAITTATTIDDLEQMIAENLVPVDTSDTSADGIHMREGGQVRVQQRVDILRRYADAGRPSPSNCQFRQSDNPRGGTTALWWDKGVLGSTPKVFLFNRLNPLRSTIMARDKINNLKPDGEYQTDNGTRCAEALRWLEWFYKCIVLNQECNNPPPAPVMWRQRLQPVTQLVSCHISRSATRGRT